jgi:membrane-bound metal-dependent hydrolase YbcI (DUF457 family)
MLLFAHLGLTLALGRFLRWVDLGFLALGSMLPDIIDKPLGLVVYGTPAAGRTFCHTLLFLLVLIALAFYLKDVRLASVSVGVTAHLGLDFMWQSPVILFWPMLGKFPIAPELRVFDYVQELLFGMRNPIIFVPEILGLSYLLYFAYESRSGIASRWHNAVEMGRHMEATIQTLFKSG